MIHIESIWSRVQPHAWKYRRRDRPINGIIWHATRGNQGYDGRTETNAAINWFTSPNNRIITPGVSEPYAGISHYLIGPGRIIEVVPPDEYIPAWSSWPSDLHAVSVEVAQSNRGQPIEPDTIKACVDFARYAEQRWNIPKVKVQQVLNDYDWSGHCGHADTVQGRSSGKSDPDEQFWGPFWKSFTEGEDEVDEMRVRQIVREELEKVSMNAGFGTPDLTLALGTIWKRIKAAGIGAKAIGDAFDPMRMP